MTQDHSRWFADWFNDSYLKVYAHRDSALAEGEVNFVLAALDPVPESRILDLCCGAGRHLRELHRRGFRRTVGIDLSEDLLTAARKEGTRSPLVRGDMRALPFKQSFDLVLSLFTSFGYFLEEEENRRVLGQIRQVLTPKGKFVLDLLPSHRAHSLVPETEREMEGLLVRERRRYDPASRRIIKEIEIKSGERKQAYVESVRVYEFREVSCLLAESGLSLLDVYGDFMGTPYSQESERMILIGRVDPGG